MKIRDTYQINADFYEGSLELLVHLIQKKELDIGNILIQEITGSFKKVFFEKTDMFDYGADFISLTAQLALIKSRRLIPQHKDPTDEPFDYSEDTSFNVIHHLLDYVKFKDAATLFSRIEENQDGLFPRGIPSVEAKLPNGLDTVSIHELAKLFNDLLAKAQSRTGYIKEEEYKVHDKIVDLQHILNTGQKISFLLLFEKLNSKMEIIVTFLAVLELLKMGDMRAVKEENEILLVRA